MCSVEELCWSFCPGALWYGLQMIAAEELFE